MRYIKTSIKIPYIAIDVVLLLPKDVMNKAIKINGSILKHNGKNKRKIMLNRRNCLPHISLAMGRIKVNDIPAVIGTLKDIIRHFRKIELEITNIDRWVIPDGNSVSGFKIGKNNNLQKLHETIMKRLLPYLSYNIKLDMLYQKPLPERITLHWIKNYLKRSSFGNFSPHITLGIGRDDRLESYNIKDSQIQDNLKLPIKFTPAKIAVCHLGNYCTCRKVLGMVKLSKNI
ncbi:hypothetical protein J4206_04455 [Candidatus Woesearchaeota archaeon]|nr:hypothetical protein [Candidatus Woesearchaeota archaeon]